MILGVEEAGRGPVLGPMVMACFWTNNQEQLKAMGAKDSKALTPVQRERLYEELTKLGTYEIIIVSPKEIDAAVTHATDNLNHLEARTSAKLINRALEKTTIKEAILDCPTQNTVKYAHDVQAQLTEKIPIIAEHKADVNYPVVSAASIIAKVTRDREVRKIQETINIPVGSGYPADPATQEFLRNHRKTHAYLFRQSWASYKNADTVQQVLPTADDPLLQLREHGFHAEPTKSPYETIRLRGHNAIIIKYTTGKLLVQGKGKAAAEQLIKQLNI